MKKNILCNICFKNEINSLGLCEFCKDLDKKIDNLLDINPKQGGGYLKKKLKDAERKSKNRYVNNFTKVKIKE
jgi:hypothetical protein